MFYRLAADFVLLTHLAFIALVVAGALPVFRYAWFAWIHLPAAAWGFFVELTGRVCPLTTLENTLRFEAGQQGYATSFVQHYLMPLIYPAGLTRNGQVWLAGLVFAFNAIIYFLIFRRKRNRSTVSNSK
jgi:hypothetical protein